MTLKDSNPFATMFVLQNDGQFSIYDVRFKCRLNHVEYANRVVFDKSVSATGGFDIPKLEANAKTSAPCYIAIENAAPVIRADVSLDVSYVPSFSFVRITKLFNFHAVRKDDGTYAWIEMAK